MRTITNRAQSAGYNTLMTEIRNDDITYDPWGTSMSWMFALAEVTYIETGEILPDFRPSPMLSDRQDIERDGNTAWDVLTMLDGSGVTVPDMIAVYAVLSRFDTWCRLAGRAY